MRHEGDQRLNTKTTLRLQAEHRALRLGWPGSRAGLPLLCSPCSTRLANWSNDRSVPMILRPSRNCRRARAGRMSLQAGNIEGRWRRRRWQRRRVAAGIAGVPARAAACLAPPPAPGRAAGCHLCWAGAELGRPARSSLQARGQRWPERSSSVAGIKASRPGARGASGSDLISRPCWRPCRTCVSRLARVRSLAPHLSSVLTRPTAPTPPPSPTLAPPACLALGPLRAPDRQPWHN